MARRISLTQLNSNSQARELPRLYLAPAPSHESPCSFCHLPHQHPRFSHPLAQQSASLPYPTKSNTKQYLLVFILNKSYHKWRTFPNYKFTNFLPFSLAVDPSLFDRPSPLEVSQTPLARLSSQEDSPLNERAVEYNTKLSQLLLELKTELPLFFEKSHPYHLYTNDIAFNFNYSPISFKLNSRLTYQILLASVRLVFRLVYSDLGLDLLKITKSESDYSIHTRWRLTCINRFSISKKPVLFDAISTFYMNEDGLIDRHTLERVYKDSRKVPTLAWLFIAIGFYPSELKDTSSAVEFASKNKWNGKNSKPRSNV
ncbi:hypothetical protein LOD99_12812 [Oopsacas minuta]|uniref:Uncharacterized protein n=1 Tax=Oopsacas minuta TaxID=111878 RepID=A0AAV7JDP0_9METZ|nr:hypothetical protein LOD99_12812 [Oopsacas minuta]